MNESNINVESAIQELQQENEQLRDRVEEVEQAVSVEDADGWTVTLPQLRSWGLTRRQALQAMGLLAAGGITLAAAVQQVAAADTSSGRFAANVMQTRAVHDQNDNVAIDLPGDGSIGVADLEIDDTYKYAADEAALNDLNLSDGDTVFLGTSTFSSDRTFSDGIQFIGSDGGNTRTQVDGNWTFNAVSRIGPGIVFGSADITFNSAVSRVFGCRFGTNATTTVDADNFSFVNNDRGDVTFNSGATNGVVDACTRTTVTDNDGGNTVGDIA